MNKVVNIKSKDVKSILTNLDRKNSYLVRLDGKKIKNECELLQSIAYGFRFPVYSKKKKKYISWSPFVCRKSYSDISWDGVNDWITDLSWIEFNSIHIFIFNYNMMLEDDLETKQYLNEYLISTLLTWWQRDVAECVVDGKPKEFIVYYVD